MTGGSEKFMEKGDRFYFGEFKNLVWMVHTNEKGRVATISEVSATPRAQIKQDAHAKYRLKYLRPDCHLPPTLYKLTTFSSQLSSMNWYL